MFCNWLFKTGLNIHSAAAGARSIVLYCSRSIDGKKILVLQFFPMEVLQLSSEKWQHLCFSSVEMSGLEFFAIPCFMSNLNSQEAN